MKKKVTIETEPQVIVGLDIGTTKIATIIGIKNPDGKIEILGHGKGESSGVQHGLIYNLPRTVDGINVSKEKALNHFDHEVDEVFVGIAGRHIKSMEYKHNITRRNGKDEIIRQDEIDNMVEDLENISVNPGEQIISVIPQRFVIDKHRKTSDPVGELGEVLEGFFQIITGNEAEIKKIVRCVNMANIDVKEIILEPIASGLSCLTHEEKRRGVVLIDIGGGTTDMAIFYDGKPVYTRVIPIGGNVITKDISKMCNIPEEMAEKLKKTHGKCVVEKSNSNNFITIPQLHGMPNAQISETTLAQIIHARVQEDILNEVKRAIKESGYAAHINNGVVLTGGGALLQHLKELSHYTLQMPVRLGIPEVGFVSNIPVELKNPMFATSLGLLKYGLENAPIPEQNEISNKVVKSPKLPKGGEGKDKNPVGRFDEIFKSINNFFNDILEKTS